MLSINYKNRKNAVIGIVLLLVLLLLSFWVQKVRSHNHTNSQRAFYRTRLTAVSENIEYISKITNEPLAMKDSVVLALYEKQLDSIIADCNAVIKNYRSSDGMSPELQKASESSAEICRDLIGITAYQQNLYGQLDVILQIDPENMSAQAAQNRLETVRTIADNTGQVRNTIRRVENRRIDDPAKQDIDTLLTELIDHADTLQNEIKPHEYDGFARHLATAQDELLIHRQTYWHITAEISNHQKLLQKQIKALAD
ncbi:hypothetical protein BH23PAT1_BH23PAT1_1090 [soil metagenome]